MKCEMCKKEKDEIVSITFHAEEKKKDVNLCLDCVNVIKDVIQDWSKQDEGFPL